jgi:hypothetical protein
MIWKETVVSLSRNCAGIWLKGLRKITTILRIAFVLAQTRTQYTPCTNIECHRYAKPYGISVSQHVVDEKGKFMGEWGKSGSR